MVDKIRLWVQICFTAVSNGYILGFAKGRIYTGALKKICVPGLNCYSCPGALGSCPIGSLQAVIGSTNYKFSFYVIGTLMVIGALCGRLVCGFLCPFGLVQDLLFRIPRLKKIRTLRADKFLRPLRFVVLGVFVIILPMFVVDFSGQGEPWFCKYICPSGTLFAAFPLTLMNEGLREAAGFLFAWKSVILVILLVLSIFIYRPFCRWLCPLGAIYSLFNPFSLYRYHIDKDKCTKCGKCRTACGFGIKVYENPNSFDCIRCGKCRDACPESAISVLRGLHRSGQSGASEHR